jgi:hypothetical protein
MSQELAHKGSQLTAHRSQLIGTWRLVSYRLIGSRGRVRYPYGEDAVGYILYGADGYMAVSIMSANRQPFAGADILRRTTEEAAEATRTYLSYSGTYEILPGRVIHHVEVSLFPNWTDTALERFYVMNGDRLELSTGPIPTVDGDGTGRPRAHLVWEKVQPRDRR